MKATDLLMHFDYSKYQGKTPREGYLYNFYPLKESQSILYKLLFLSNNGKFYIELPFYPYVLIESNNNELLVEVLNREYKSKIYRINEIEKHDTKLKNHLNLPPRKYLQVHFYSETDFKNAIDYFSTIKKKRNYKEKFEIKTNLNGIKTMDKTFVLNRSKGYAELGNYDDMSDIASLDNLIIDIHEYDVPIDISFMIENNIRCGKYYNVCYLHEKYVIDELDIIVPPEIITLAFDIETWKKPLRFPDSETDQIIMISGVVNNNGFLIVNNEFVTKEIMNFEYKVEVDTRIIGIEVYNCQNERKMLLQFIEKVMQIKPDILTTFNGDVFDIPYIEKRMVVSNLQYSFSSLMHLDCFKWVRRDSYLPMGSQGLKAVTKIKLGYIPDEIDPEEMVIYAQNDPEKLAAYSVSDSVATWLLYSKYVHPFIFSLCTLIPLNPSDVLSKGSGTLCESLLIAESWNYMVLIPSKRMDCEVLYDGRFCEDVSYTGGHVECLKSGIFRKDFIYDFRIKNKRLKEIKHNLMQFKDFSEIEKYELNERIDSLLKKNDSGDYINITSKPLIYHLDVSAMYPNIILTNRLQPISVIDESDCINCDYYDEIKLCQRKMKWNLKVEYIPTKKEEIKTIENRLRDMSFDEKHYLDLKEEEKTKILKDKTKDYAKSFYKKLTDIESFEMENVVCQREIPFYVDIVKRFRDRRNEFKSKYKVVKGDIENIKSMNQSEIELLNKKLIIYESLQVAHKCILNSFYGYTMRRNSRWFCIDMAAIVCHTGAQVIKEAKKFIDDIGITLELDTDGIWCLIPDVFPTMCIIDEKRSNNLLSAYMNFIVESKFTNHQFQEKDTNGKYVIEPTNYIDFEIDGPYKAMVLPSSIEEGKSIKKRYVVIDNENKICEIKGFELKRRGELKIVKIFQEELFPLFVQGDNLTECYHKVKEHCLYYLKLIESKGSSLSDYDIFDLFCESKNMSKEFKDYDNRKSTSTGTALKLSEFLGSEILNRSGLKCEFIISKFPNNFSVTDRAIPTKIFQVEESKKCLFLKKWLRCDLTDIRDILDWDYYYERLKNTILRIVVLPSMQQGITNLIPEIQLPQWAGHTKSKSLMEFGIVEIDQKIKDSNDSLHRNLEDHDIIKPNYTIKDDYSTYVLVKKTEWDNIRDNLFRVNIIKIYNGTMTYVKNKRIFTKTYNVENKYIIDLSKHHFDDQKVEFKANGFEMTSTDNVNMYYISIYKNIFVNDEENMKILYNNFNVKSIIPCHIKDSDQIINTKSKDIQKRINNKSICFHIDDNNIKVNIILSFRFDNSSFYIHMFGDVIKIFTENKTYSNDSKIIVSSFQTYMKGIDKENSLFVIEKSGKNGEVIENYLKRNKALLIYVSIPQSTLFLGLHKMIEEYQERLLLIKEKISGDNELSRCLNIPFINIFEANNYEILDQLLSRRLEIVDYHMKDLTNKKYNQFKTYGHKTGFYQKYSIEIIISSISASSIINHAFLSENSQESTFNENFNKLENICKFFIIQISNAKIQNNFDLVYRMNDILESINFWVIKKSNYLTKNTKNYFSYTYSRMLNLMINSMLELDIEVIHFDRNIFIVNTNKKTRSSCLKYYEYLENTLKKIKMFENISLKLGKVFHKLVIVDTEKIFFTLSHSSKDEELNNRIYSSKNISMVKNFIKKFFSGEINDEYFYNLIFMKKYSNFEVVKNMIDIYGTLKNVDKLRDSCYYALGVNPFKLLEYKEMVLECFCSNCDKENNIFSNLAAVMCKYCLENIDQNVINNTAYQKIQELITESKFLCDKCRNRCNILDAFKCLCGGVFIYYPEILEVKCFLKYIKNDEMVAEIVSYLETMENDNKNS